MVTPPGSATYGMTTPLPRTLRWSAEAEARLARIPSFVRAVVASRLEAFARDRGVAEITVDLMSEVRRDMPVDFSKARPFFLREQ